MERELRSALDGTGFTFKKKFGQNFISDSQLLNRIVDGAGVNANSTVIEIGCGAGTLTKAIAQKAKYVYGYEIDNKTMVVEEMADGCMVLALYQEGYDTERLPLSASDFPIEVLFNIYEAMK